MTSTIISNTAAVWPAWTSTTSTTTTSITCPWPFWVSANGTTATTIATWGAWQRVVYQPVVVPQKTPEQLAAERRFNEVLERERRASEALRVAARGRAKRLLVESLTMEQRAQYEQHGHFDVLLEGKRYRIHQGTHGNIHLLDEKLQRVERYCVQPDGVPVEDAMLAQKLALELAPREFFAKANVTRLRA